MMNKKALFSSISYKVIVPIIILLFHIRGYGQESDAGNEGIPTVDQLAKIPISPEAQAYINYGNIPVSMYTGTPNINIPIATIAGCEIETQPDTYSFNVNGLSGTVSIDYNTGTGICIEHPELEVVQILVSTKPPNGGSKLISGCKIRDASGTEYWFELAKVRHKMVVNAHNIII